MGLGNWVGMTTSTTGTGSITLGSAIDNSYVSFSDQYSDGEEVYYSITDGDNRENGVGIYTSTGTILSRDTILETLVAGTFDNTSPTAIALTGSAVVTVTANSYSMTKHETIWKDNLTSMTTASGGGTNPPDLINFIGTIQQYAFDSVSNEEVFVSFHINHDHKPDTDILGHIHWAPSDTSIGTVRWGFEYSIAARDTGAFTVVNTVYFEDTTDGTAFQHRVIGDTQPVTLPTPEVDTVIIARVFRDASHVNDTYAADAFGLFVDLHYESDRIGTPQNVSDFYAW